MLWPKMLKIVNKQTTVKSPEINYILKSAVVDTQRKLSDNLKAVNDSEVIRNKLKTTYYKRYRRERRQL